MCEGNGQFPYWAYHSSEKADVSSAISWLKENFRKKTIVKKCFTKSSLCWRSSPIQAGSTFITVWCLHLQNPGGNHAGLGTSSLHVISTMWHHHTLHDHLLDFAAILSFAMDKSGFFSCYCSKTFTVTLLGGWKRENCSCELRVELGWCQLFEQDRCCCPEQSQLKYCCADGTVLRSLEKMVGCHRSWTSDKNKSEVFWTMGEV